MADDLYDKLMDRLRRGKDKGANYHTLKSELREIVDAEPARYLNMFFNNWFNNNWTRKLEFLNEKKIINKPYRPKPKLTREQLTERRKADANLRGLALMNIFMSDGETRLKDASGSQVRLEAGWFQLIAKHVKPNEIVGRVLTAEQLFNLKVQSEPSDRRVA